MKKLLSLTLLGVGAAASIGQERSLSPEYHRANQRFERKCESFDEELVAELQDLLAKSGETERPKLAKVAREWAQGKELPSQFRHCMSAATSLYATEKYLPPPPPPRMSLSNLDAETRNYIKASESCRKQRARPAQQRLQSAQDKVDTLAKTEVTEPTGILGRMYFPGVFTSHDSLVQARQKADVNLRNARLNLKVRLSQFCEPALKMQLNSVGHLGSPNVLQVISPTEMHITFGEFRAIVRDVSTSGLVDGLTASIPGVFRVAGTETYTTALGGSNTVFVIEPTKISAEAVARWRRENGLN